MSTINSILLPIDFSDVARNAFRYAAEIARKTSAHIYLFYCIPDSATDSSPFIITPYFERLKEARRHMDKFIREENQLAQENNVAMPVISKVVNGDGLKAGVEKLVKEKDIDILIMGTKGRAGEWKKAFGSKSSYLINHAPCPVLVVPAEVEYHFIERICIATDQNMEATAREQRIDKLFAFCEPELFLVHVVTANDNPGSGELHDFHRPSVSKQADSPVHFTEINSTDVVGGLFSYASQNTCQLVAMYRPEKTWLERIFKASNTREAILRANLPVLIVSERHGEG